MYTNIQDVYQEDRHSSKSSMSIVNLLKDEDFKLVD
ncbi:unnamed protein product, partial [Rotaria sp. Silwood2]